MCERRDSIQAVNAAADELLRACSGRNTYRDVLNGTVRAPLPPDLANLLHQLDIPAGQRVAITIGDRRRGKHR